MGQVDRFNSNDIVSCTLNDWLELHSSVEEKRETFLNMEESNISKKCFLMMNSCSIK